MKRIIPILLFVVLLGCATQTPQQKSDASAALQAVVAGALAYSQGNTAQSAVDGIQGAAFLLRSLQSTPQAAQPAAVASAVTSGGVKSTALVDTIAAATAALVHAGVNPDVANEAVAGQLDKATK